jgi:hypothetical protein
MRRRCLAKAWGRGADIKSNSRPQRMKHLQSKLGLRCRLSRILRNVNHPQALRDLPSRQLSLFFQLATLLFCLENGPVKRIFQTSWRFDEFQVIKIKRHQAVEGRLSFIPLAHLPKIVDREASHHQRRKIPHNPFLFPSPMHLSPWNHRFSP